MVVVEQAVQDQGDAPAAPRLGVPGFPEPVVELARGQVYAIAVDAQPLRLPLVAQTLHDTLERGLKAALVLPGDPAAFAAKAKLGGVDLGWWREHGELAIARLKADPLLPLFRAGPVKVLEEIDRLVPDGTVLVVLEQAEPLLFFGDGGLSQAAADGLREWAARRGLTVIATFSPGMRPQREALALRAVADDLAGHAVVREHEGGARLELRHWFGARGAVPRDTLSLRLEAGALVGQPMPALPERLRGEVAHSVVAVAGALDDPTAAVRDARWTVVQSSAEALEASRRVGAGAVVLAFDKDTPMRAIGAQIAAVRRAASPWVSVVVRERGLRLRLGQQVALVRLGASCVVPDGQDDAALEQALRALSGSAFMRSVPDDVEAVLAAAGTTATPQLLVTRAFRDLVSEVLVAGDAVDVPHSLLHVACDPAKAQQLGTLALQRRLRDAALAVDPSGLWMFLFGCPAGRAGSVAQRALGRAYPEVSASITVVGGAGAIAKRVERMAAAVGMPEIDAPRRLASARPS